MMIATRNLLNGKWGVWSNEYQCWVGRADYATADDAINSVPLPGSSEVRDTEHVSNTLVAAMAAPTGAPRMTEPEDVPGLEPADESTEDEEDDHEDDAYVRECVIGRIALDEQGNITQWPEGVTKEQMTDFQIAPALLEHAGGRRIKTITYCEFGFAEELLFLIEYYDYDVNEQSPARYETGVGESLRPTAIYYIGPTGWFARKVFLELLEKHV